MKAVRVDVNWNPQLPIFASESYLRHLGPEYGWIGGMNEGGALACVLPYVVIRKARLRLVRFTVEPIPLGAEFDLEQERQFLNAAVALLRSMKTDVVIPATFSTLFRTCPDGAIPAPYGNFIVDLTRGEDALWQGIHHKHRNVIRNAVKTGVTVRTGSEYLESAYALTRESFIRSARNLVERRRVESRLDIHDFQRLVEDLGQYVRVLVAEHQGTIQSAAIIPFSQHSAYYMHGGSIAKPMTGASNLLQWEAMRAFAGLGVRRYDFFGARVAPEPGSKADGIAKFKERFGGAFHTGWMWKIPFSRPKYALYQLAARIRNGGDVVDQERRRARARDRSHAVDPASPTLDTHS